MNPCGPLSIAVCAKICPDTAQVSADPRTGAPRLRDAPLRIGTFDENAMEEAVRLKEEHGGKVMAVCLCAHAPPPELILRVLAMGADEAYVVEDDSVGQADPLATARVLAAVLEKLAAWNLVLCGDGSLDGYNRQVGARIAQELGLPVLTQVTRVEVQGGTLRIDQALEDRTVTVEAALPILLTVGQEINQPRFPTVLQIMGASRKPKVTWNLGDLGFIGETAQSMSGVKTIEVFAPAEQRRRIAIRGESPRELARALAGTLFEQGLVKIE